MHVNLGATVSFSLLVLKADRQLHFVDWCLLWEEIYWSWLASLQVKEFTAHTAAVNDLSFDVEGEYIGSCSDDGSVVINSLFTDEKIKFEYHRPMKAIALDPDYAKKSSRRFVAGGLAGHLYFNSKKWLGFRDQVCAWLLT